MNDVENNHQEETNTNNLPTTKKVSPPAIDKTLILLIGGWYVSSAITTNTSKILELPGTTLTFCQMFISTICAALGIIVFKLNDVGGIPRIFPTEKAAFMTIVLSLVFCGGLITLNASIGSMHVSTVMTLRAAEPVSTWLFSIVLLPKEETSCNALLCLIPIVLGAGLSAIAPGTNVNVHGFALVVVCNVFFSLRTIITKLLKKANKDIDNYTLFFQLCVLGSIWQGIILVTLGVESLKQVANYPLLLLNGFTFYLYLQLSWIVMSKVGAVTHSVCNSLRRPFICSAGWFVFGGITWEGIAGVLVATGGTMLYAMEKRKEIKR